MAKSRKERRLRRISSKKSKDKDKDEEPEEEQPKQDKKVYANKFAEIYDVEYKKLLLIPILLLLGAFLVIGLNIVQTGDFMNKAVSLKGGITLTVPSEETINVADLESFLESNIKQGDVSVRQLTNLEQQIGVIIEASDISEDKLISLVEQNIGQIQDYSVETIGPSLGASFFRQTMFAVLLAFVFMGLVVFWYFRTFVPSIAVILAAFSDIVVTLAIVDVMGMKIGTAGIAAFLMLIGYSVDTDILLSTRVLKTKEGTIMDRVYSAMKTGLTMNATTIVAVGIALIVSDSEVISQIMIIIFIGLLVDIINTWLQNVGILRYYLERKGNNE